MSENKKLSFRKRISIVKSTVIKTLLESKELSKLGSGSSKNGYYSLSTIMEVFQPALVENDLDFEIEMDDDKVIGTWMDCDSDMIKPVIFHLKRLAKIIENLERLPQMQNAIQTEGSIKTYFRRYALTAFLNLPATDEIDTNLNGSHGSQKSNQKSQKKNSQPAQKLSGEEKPEQPYTPDLDNVAKLAEHAGFSGDDLFKLIKALFNKSELLKLDPTEEVKLTEYLSIKANCKIANVSHEEFNKYLFDAFKKKNWFSLTAEEKLEFKETLKKMIKNLNAKVG
jgi:hypothetical protein